MTIEFHTQHGLVSEDLLKKIRDEIIHLSHSNPEISRAEVVLNEDKMIVAAERKLCSIRLTIFGNNLLARSRSETYERSAKSALAKLKQLLKKQHAKKGEVPEVITSTVSVK